MQDIFKMIRGPVDTDPELQAHRQSGETLFQTARRLGRLPADSIVVDSKKRRPAKPSTTLQAEQAAALKDIGEKQKANAANLAQVERGLRRRKMLEATGKKTLREQFDALCIGPTKGLGVKFGGGLFRPFSRTN